MGLYINTVLNNGRLMEIGQMTTKITKVFKQANPKAWDELYENESWEGDWNPFLEFVEAEIVKEHDLVRDALFAIYFDDVLYERKKELESIIFVADIIRLAIGSGRSVYIV